MIAQVVIQAVYQLLMKHDVVLATQFILTFRLESDCEMQRAIVLLNRHWRDYLAQSPHNTIDARTYLVDVCEFVDWLRLFETGVIPELLRHGQAR